MNDFGANFKSFLRGKADIANLVGQGPAARIFPTMLRQGATMPAIVYEEGDGGESYEYINEPGIAGVARTIMHVWAFGATRSQADDLSDRLRLALQHYRGNMGDCEVLGIHVIGGRDHGDDKSNDKSDIHRYWTRRVYSIHHAEPTS